MRSTFILATLAILLIVDQVRTGGHYRREAAYAVGHIIPGSSRVLAALY
jgi:hypothetical protein